MLNKCSKELDKKDVTDTNVGSIAEDIKYVKECLEIARVFLKAVKVETDYKELDDIAFCNSVEHLIQDHARQKQINEEHKKINRRIKRKNKRIRRNNIRLSKNVL